MAQDIIPARMVPLRCRQECSQALKSGHSKCAIGHDHMNNLKGNIWRMQWCSSISGCPQDAWTLIWLKPGYRHGAPSRHGALYWGPSSGCIQSVGFIQSLPEHFLPKIAHQDMLLLCVITIPCSFFSFRNVQKDSDKLIIIAKKICRNLLHSKVKKQWYLYGNYYWWCRWEHFLSKYNQMVQLLLLRHYH